MRKGKKTLLERFGNKLGFSRGSGAEWEYDFTPRAAIKSGWILLAISSLTIVFLTSAELCGCQVISALVRNLLYRGGGFCD